MCLLKRNQGKMIIDVTAERKVMFCSKWTLVIKQKGFCYLQCTEAIFVQKVQNVF